MTPESDANTETDANRSLSAMEKVVWTAIAVLGALALGGTS